MNDHDLKTAGEGPARLPRKPDWLKARPLSGAAAEDVQKTLRELALHTVCTEAGCPNCGECFNRKTAAFLIMGNICSRNCRFCQVGKGQPQPLDPAEPLHLALAAEKLQLRHIVITSVTRDDLPDGGASHFAAVIEAIRSQCRASRPVIEVLIPDFQGSRPALEIVIQAGPDILNHNIETVPRLYPEVRPQAIYARSLELLGRARQIAPGLVTKSGLMAGLGETPAEVLQTLRDLREQQCSMLTIGQYLAPSRNHYPVQEYIHPDLFAWYKQQAEAMGFAAVAAGPLVRSSYMADQLFLSSPDLHENLLK